MILFYQPSHARRGVASRRSRNSGIGVLFHRSQFDWPEHILSLVLAYFALPTPNFFPPLHFDWQTGAFPFPESEPAGDLQAAGRAVREGLVRKMHPIFISPITL